MAPPVMENGIETYPPLPVSVTLKIGNNTYKIGTTLSHLDGAVPLGAFGPVTLNMRPDELYELATSKENVYTLGGILLAYDMPGCEGYHIDGYDDELVSLDVADGYPIIRSFGAPPPEATVPSAGPPDVWSSSKTSFIQLVTSLPPVRFSGCSNSEEGGIISIPADGASETFAEVPGVVGCSWSFVESPSGARIEPVTDGNSVVVGARIQSGTVAGTAIVRASCPDNCEYRGRLTLEDSGMPSSDSPGGAPGSSPNLSDNDQDDSSCGSSDCLEPGTIQISSSGGPKIEFSLGPDSIDDSGGTSFEFGKWSFDSSNFSPSGLVVSQNGRNTEWIYYNDNLLRQALAPTALVDVAISGTNSSGIVTSYELKFYRTNDVGSISNGLYTTLPMASPFSHWRVSNADTNAATYNQIQISDLASSPPWTNYFLYSATNEALPQTDEACG